MTGLSYPPSKNAVQKTLGATLAAGATTVTLNNVTSIQNKYGVFVVDRVDSNGTETPTKREYISFAGTSGLTCTGLVRNVDGSGTDQEHSVGAIVEFCPDVIQDQATKDVILVEHNDAGTHKSTLVTTLKATGAEINTGTEDAKIVTPKAIADSNVLTTTNTKTVTNKTITPVALINTVISYTPDASATATLDVATGNIHKITMPAGNITIAISNEATGQCFLIEITQDSVGSRTVTWFTTIKWAGGSAPTLTTTANKRDVFGFRVTGTDTYDGYIVGQNI